MRCSSFVVMFLFSNLASSAWCAEPDGQAAQAKRQELIKRQQADNLEIDHVANLIESFESGEFRSVGASGMRIAADYLIHLQQTRDARAADYWKSLDIKLPLRKPLSKQQLDGLSKFFEVFQDSKLSRAVYAVLRAHDEMESSETSRQMLNSVQWNSPNNDITNEDGTLLDSIALQFAGTEAAFLFGMALSTYRDQWLAAEFARIRRLVPSEQAARRRLINAFAQYCQFHVKFSLQQSIAEMVEDYPETTAARTRLPDNAEQLARQQLDRVFEDYLDDRNKDRLRTAFADIVEVFPETEAARSLSPNNLEQIARKHLDRVFTDYNDVRDSIRLREQLADFVDVYSNTEATRLLSPTNAEQLASKHLSEAHVHFRCWKNKALMKSELAAIVAAFPKTEAAKTARTHLEIVKQAIQSDAGYERRVRDYWDSVYPSRVKNSPQSR